MLLNNHLKILDNSKFLAAALLAVVLVGCGGTGGGGNSPNTNENSSTNININNNDNQATDDNSNSEEDNNENSAPQEFAAEITGLPADNSVSPGESYPLTAVVSGETGVIAFEWSIEQQEEIATLSETNVSNPILTIGGEGDFTLSVVVVDDQDYAQDFINATSSSSNSPPPEAELNLLVDIVIVEPGDFVSLIATTEGPIPNSISWAPGPDNIIHPIDFFDIGNGTATFTAPSQFQFIYILEFTVTATYETGSLSKTMEVQISGGPG